MSGGINVYSSEWLVVKAFCEGKLKEKRAALEEKGLAQDLTEGLREGIAVLDEILELPDQDPTAVDDPDKDYGLGTEHG
tara:strand:- start:1519 stop:1755 length:237 start_codon:yes stop_codon:yes gene_type:complete